MAQIRTFKELKVWEKSHELVLNIYAITQNFPKEEKFGLTSQIRRAAISVASNIVEGFRRRTLKDSLHFYNIADGSLEEVKYQLLLSLDLKFINRNDFNNALNLAEATSKMLFFWIKSQKSKSK